MDEAAGLKYRKFASTGTLHHPNSLTKQNINKHKYSKVLFAGKISNALQGTTEKYICIHNVFSKYICI